MPKLLANAREEILAAASDQLLHKGYHGLAMRDVAAQCGMAAGTVYNYFPSKLDLVSHILLNDWNRSLAALDEALRTAPDCETVLASMYGILSMFCTQYRTVWADSRQSPEAMAVMNARVSDRASLHGQLADRLVQSFLRLGRPDLADGYLPVFLVRNLLQHAMEPGFDYSILSPVIRRLLDHSVHVERSAHS